MNRVIVENIKTAIEKSQGKISFVENKPRLISCCFSQVLELDVNEVWYNNGLHFHAKNQKPKKYQLKSKNFLFGKAREVEKRREIMNKEKKKGHAE